MAVDGFEHDAEIIRDAYAEKVKEAFRLFAENISVGQAEKACRDRFVRSLDLMRRARDIALEASTGTRVATADETAAATPEPAADPLSAEDLAAIEHAIAGTTGAKPIQPPQPIRRF